MKYPTKGKLKNLREYNESRVLASLIVDGRTFRRMKRKGLI